MAYKLKTVQITLCQMCLDGIGEMCTTPGCAMFLHRVDLPFHEGIYETISVVEMGDDDYPIALSALPPAAGEVG